MRIQLNYGKFKCIGFANQFWGRKIELENMNIPYRYIKMGFSWRHQVEIGLYEPRHSNMNIAYKLRCNFRSKHEIIIFCHFYVLILFIKPYVIPMVILTVIGSVTSLWAAPSVSWSVGRSFIIPSKSCYFKLSHFDTQNNTRWHEHFAESILGQHLSLCRKFGAL